MRRFCIPRGAGQIATGLFVLVGAVFAPPLAAQNLALEYTLSDPTPSLDGDGFGQALSLGADHLLVGAPSDDTLGFRVGQAHLYDVSTGALLQTFDDPTPAFSGIFGDHFGTAVSVTLATSLVGDPDNDPSGLVGVFDVGQAHLFDNATGALLRTFEDPMPLGGSGAGRQNFGRSLAQAGGRALIGAPSTDIDTGRAHLFDISTGALLHSFDDPTPEASNGFFGWSVDLLGDHVLIGDFADSNDGHVVGQAHLFDAGTGNFIRTFHDPTPTPSDGFGDRFGLSLGLSSDLAVIGASTDDTNGHFAGQAHVFDLATGSLTHTLQAPTPMADTLFGASVAVDGDEIAVGDEAGNVFIFDATTGDVKQALTGFARAGLTPLDIAGGRLAQNAAAVADTVEVFGAFDPVVTIEKPLATAFNPDGGNFLDSRVGVGPQKVADEFFLARGGAVQSVMWYGAFAPAHLSTTLFEVQFYADVSGTPAMDPYFAHVFDLAAGMPTGVTLSSIDVLAYEADLSGLNVLLGPGQWWISIRAGDPAAQFFWSIAEPLLGDPIFHRFNDASAWSMPVGDGRTEMAFALTAHVPEPGMGLLFASGLGGLALMMGRHPVRRRGLARGEAGC